MNSTRFWYLSALCFCFIIGCSPKHLYVMDTTAGDIKFKVYPKKAPITVANFVKYVERGDFEGASFYRVVRMDNQPNSEVKIEVIQGNFTAFENRFESINMETTDKTGIRHKDGTLSMARASDPNSASAAFFICINDQPELDFGGKRNPDGLGFAAFGDVLEGMDVVRQIQAGSTDKQTLVRPVVIREIKAVSKK